MAKYGQYGMVSSDTIGWELWLCQSSRQCEWFYYIRTHSIYSLCRLIWRDEKFSLHISDGQQNIFTIFTQIIISHMLAAASQPTGRTPRISPLEQERNLINTNG